MTDDLSTPGEDPAESLPCPCDCSCESLADCLRLADERWPDPPHWPAEAHRIGVCCDDSGMVADPVGEGLIPCPGVRNVHSSTVTQPSGSAGAWVARCACGWSTYDAAVTHAAQAARWHEERHEAALVSDLLSPDFCACDCGNCESNGCFEASRA